MMHTDTERTDWLERGGIERLLCEKTLGSSFPRFRIRIRNTPTFFEFSDRQFDTLRDAVDFGIDTPESQ